MKLYLSSIQYLQKFFLGISILMMLILPLLFVFYPDEMSETVTLRLYDISHISIFFVMLIRPLADIFFNTRFIRPLVILRKGVGVLSASVVISVIFSKIIIDPSAYLGAFTTTGYWSFHHYAFIAHAADISAIILLITSNNLSKRILRVWWKKIQKLSYVFFYASALYVFLSYGHISLLFSIIIVTTVTYIAHIKNKQRRQLNLKTT